MPVLGELPARIERAYRTGGEEKDNNAEEADLECIASLSQAQNLQLMVV
jgi:hypothetical protein